MSSEVLVNGHQASLFLCLQCWSRDVHPRATRNQRETWSCLRHDTEHQGHCCNQGVLLPNSPHHPSLMLSEHESSWFHSWSRPATHGLISSPKVCQLLNKPLTLEPTGWGTSSSSHISIQSFVFRSSSMVSVTSCLFTFPAGMSSELSVLRYSAKDLPRH